MKNHNEQQLLQQHTPLVSALVNRLVASTPQTCSADHLHSLGLIALLDAARCYPQTSSVPFESFARIQVQSALIGEINRAKRWFSPVPAKNHFLPAFV